MSIPPVGPPYTTITIDTLLSNNADVIMSITGYCIRYEIDFSVRFDKRDFKAIIRIDAETATLMKLKFAI